MTTKDGTTSSDRTRGCLIEDLEMPGSGRTLEAAAAGTCTCTCTCSAAAQCD
jgi:hypothetical protein